MRRRIVQPPYKIPSRWGGKCDLCKCRVEKEQDVLFYPPDGKSPLSKGRITHIYDWQCGSLYHVHVTYQSSRKVLKVPAYDAQGALAQGQSTLRNAKAQPWEWLVYQGNVQVLRVVLRG